MNTHNICFYCEIRDSSLNYHQISPLSVPLIDIDKIEVGITFL